MTSVAGVIVLALFVLWLGYYVPHHVKHRQQLLDSRAEDRFSGSLRVLAVATGATSVQSQKIQEQKNSTELTDRQSNAGPLLQRTPARGVPVGATYVTRSTTQPEQEEGTNAMETTTRVTEPRPPVPARPGTGSSDGRPAARRAPSASRLALLERRAAAARRRLALTVVLLVASAVVWATAGLGVVPWLVALIPTALLALVLVLGRQAVRAGRRADAAWSAQRKGAARSSQGPTAGRAAASESSALRITGHAVRTSQTRTQMIPRVTAADVARAREHVAEAVAADMAADVPEVVTESGEAVVTDAAAEEMTAVARADAWDPVPVPRPTYTMKATAPRREPMPLPSDEPADTNGETVAPVDATPSGTESGASTGVKPKTETLGLDLNQILARRRASGQ